MLSRPPIETVTHENKEKINQMVLSGREIKMTNIVDILKKSKERVVHIVQ